MSGVLDMPDPAPGATLREVDPRVRVVGLVAFAVGVVMLRDFGALLIALAATIAALVHVRLPVGPTLRQVATVEGFMVVLLLSLPFTTPGTPFLTVGPLEASREGLAEAVRIALKANAAVLAVLVLVGTMGPVRLGHALAGLRVPTPFVQLLLFTVRYIAVLDEESRRLRRAMRARGFVAGANRHSLRTTGHLVGMLLVRALDRSERVMEAMRCRGFTGVFHAMDEPAPLGRREAGFIGGLAALLLGLGTLDALRG